jgi:hypothetical protein
MRKVKRVKFQILDEIIGKEFETAREMCSFNGYSLSNNIDIDKSYDLRVITYELVDNKIASASFCKK